MSYLSYSDYLSSSLTQSTSWAQWLWFTAAILGFIFVDAYAVKCLSGEEGDIIHSYLRGFFRSTSKQAKDKEVDDVAVEIENGDEENPVTEEEEVVSSPIQPNDISIEMTEQLASDPRPVSARSVGSGSSKKVVTGPRRRQQKENV